MTRARNASPRKFVLAEVEAAAVMHCNRYLQSWPRNAPAFVRWMVLTFSSAKGMAWPEFVGVAAHIDLVREDLGAKLRQKVIPQTLVLPQAGAVPACLGYAEVGAVQEP